MESIEGRKGTTLPKRQQSEKTREGDRSSFQKPTDSTALYADDVAAGSKPDSPGYNAPPVSRIFGFQPRSGSNLGSASSRRVASHAAAGVSSVPPPACRPDNRGDGLDDLSGLDASGEFSGHAGDKRDRPALPPAQNHDPAKRPFGHPPPPAETRRRNPQIVGDQGMPLAGTPPGQQFPRPHSEAFRWRAIRTCFSSSFLVRQQSFHLLFQLGDRCGVRRRPRITTGPVRDGPPQACRPATASMRGHRPRSRSR